MTHSFRDLIRHKRKIFALIAFLLVSVGCFSPLIAQSLNLDLGQQGGSTTARFVQFVFLISVLSLAPSLLVMVTSFTRIIVVLSFLRSALGLQQSPPNAVLMSLALFLTAFVMAPSIERSYKEGILPYSEEKISEEEAFIRTVAPMKEFMLQQVKERELDLFMNLAKIEPLKDVTETPLRVLIPAFMISELKRAFEIGFLIFLPFIVIDMLVASILMSMGMMMLPPMMISLPFKIIFFVMVDGWYLLSGSLLKSFGLGG
ncbi:MAG: flagellar type III secretion system pore protein FliP [Candidatus Nucleicultricaceae bacterium]